MLFIKLSSPARPEEKNCFNFSIVVTVWVFLFMISLVCPCPSSDISYFIQDFICLFSSVYTTNRTYTLAQRPEQCLYVIEVILILISKTKMNYFGWFSWWRHILCVLSRWLQKSRKKCKVLNLFWHGWETIGSAINH